MTKNDRNQNFIDSTWTERSSQRATKLVGGTTTTTMNIWLHLEDTDPDIHFILISLCIFLVPMTLTQHKIECELIYDQKS